MLIRMMGIRRNEKVSTEEIRAMAGVPNASEKLGEAIPRWLGHVQRTTGICSNENTEYGSEWISKDRKTKTEVERCSQKYMKESGVQREAKDRRTWRMKT